MKKSHRELLEKLGADGVAAALADLGFSIGQPASCPFADERHDDGEDTNPSFSVGDKGKAYCHACGYRCSSVVGLYQDFNKVSYNKAIQALWSEHVETIVPAREVLDAERKLRGNPFLLAQLQATRGITMRTVLKYKLGFAGNRLWMPVTNEVGFVVDVRKHDTFNRRAEGKPKIISYAKGFGGARVFPHPPSTTGAVYVMEGELDTLLALQHGLNAITLTGGALTLAPMLPYLRNRDVIVVADNDRTGKEGADARARAAMGAGARRARVVHLPVENKHEDFTDWVLKYDGNPTNILQHVHHEIDASAAAIVDVEPARPQIDLGLTEAEQRIVDGANQALTELSDEGQFFRDVDTERLFYLPSGQSPMLVKAGKDSVFALHLLRRCPAVNGATTRGRAMLQHIVAHASQHAQHVKMGSWSFYSHPATIYLASDNDSMLVADRRGVTKAASWQANTNSRNVVLSMPSAKSGVKHLDDTAPNKAVEEFFRVMRNVACSKKDRYLLACWLATVLMREFCRHRPLMRFEAASSSSKTTACELITSLVYGDVAVDAMATTNASNWDRARTHPLLAFDNVETRNITSEFEDFLLISATGGRKSKRARDTDSGNVVEESNSLILTNGIEPFARHELINRTIVVKIDKHAFGRRHWIEHKVRSRLLHSRDTIWNGLLKLASTKVFPRIAQGEISRIASEFPNHSMARFNDFFALMCLWLDAFWPYAPCIGYGQPRELVNEWIDDRDKQQQEHIADTDQILYYLDTMLDRRNAIADLMCNISVQGQRVQITGSVSQLLSDFRVVARSLGVRVAWNNPSQLGSRLVDAHSALVADGWELQRTIRMGRQILKLTRG